MILLSATLPFRRPAKKAHHKRHQTVNTKETTSIYTSFRHAGAEVPRGAPGSPEGKGRDSF